ncbi:MAG: GTP 3',8-cyclase MoaA [Thermodesulfobacteriota bacterium]
MIVDKYGRGVNYLRISVTDRCNLCCFYCRDSRCIKFLPHESILRYEEMLRIISAAGDTGVSKLRLTGGEPFARKGLISFVEMIRSDYPDMDLRITTNGTLLAKKIDTLRRKGLKHLNISLDTLNRKKYEKITGRDLYKRVRQAIDDALASGFRVKINIVALKGINDDELAEFVRFALNNPLDVRFIEFMPVGGKTLWNQDFYWSCKDILSAAQKITPLEAVPEHKKTSGPAKLFALPEGKGRLGVISPLSNHFCNQCNRLRVTPDGRLRTCLFSDKEYLLRGLLRSPKISQAQFKKVVETAAKDKPLGYKLLKEHQQQNESVCQKIMSAIGG